jgi:hypothetical protein
LNPDEVPVVMGLVWARLYELLEARMDPLYAEKLYRVLYRFHYYSPGRPWYPEFTWSMVDALLSSVEAATDPLNDPYIDRLEEVDD